MPRDKSRHMDDMVFGEWLRSMRARRRVTQDEFAAEVGISRALVAAWESEHQLPTKIAQVISMADWARVPAEALFSLVLAGYRDAGLDPVDQARYGLYRNLSKLAAGDTLEALSAKHQRALRDGFGDLPDSSANDGIVPTLSQPWGRCVALAQADHLDIIGHFRDEEDPLHPYDWLTTRSNFRSEDFHDVWRRVVDFLAEAG